MIPGSKIKLLFFAGIITFSLALIAFVLSMLLFFQKPKVAYAYNNKILNEYAGIKDARKAFKQNLTTWQTNLDTVKL